MSEYLEQIQAEEKRLGRQLSPVERMAFAPAGRRLGNAESEDWKIVSTETTEGKELKKSFDEKVKLAESIHNLDLKHEAVIAFNHSKRILLQKFREGKLQRVKPSGDDGD